MNPHTSKSDGAKPDENTYFALDSAPTSPWTDALHQAWTPSRDAGQLDDERDRPDDAMTNALTDTYNG